MVYAPIYKDTVYTYSGETLDFRIESPRYNVLYEGEVTEKPDGSPATIYVNKICEPFLRRGLLAVPTGMTVQSGMTRTFYLTTGEYEDDRVLETYNFISAYSGDWDGRWDKVLSDPIRPNISRNMVFPYSVYRTEAGTVTISNTQ